MATYVLPAFNLTANVWRNGNPTSNPPDVVTKGNKGLGRRVTTGPDSGLSVGIDSLFRFILLPVDADVRGKWQSGGSDTMEVPAGSGRFYTVQDIDYVGEGFANDHQMAILNPISPLPFVPPPPPADFVTAGQGDFSSPLALTVPAFTKINVLVTMVAAVHGAIPLVVTSSVAGTLTPVITQGVVATARKGEMAVYVWTNGGTAETLSISTTTPGVFFVAELWQAEGTGVDASNQQLAASPASITTTLGVPTANASEAVMMAVAYWDAAAAAPSWSTPWQDLSVGPTLNGPVSADTFGVYVGWITQVAVGTPSNTVTFGGPAPDEAGTQMIAFVP